MQCPNCGSKNVRVQHVTQPVIEHRGCISWTFWILLAIFTCGLVLIIPALNRIKTETYVEATCQDCGASWEVG